MTGRSSDVWAERNQTHTAREVREQHHRVTRFHYNINMMNTDNNNTIDTRRIKRMELLAPAGGMEQLRAAIDFGADAVYLATDRFGMRARAANFSMEELPRAVALAHEHGVKVHLTCNILMMPDDIRELPAFFEEVQASEVDALIIGDIGAFSLAKRYAPKCELHVSTQASVANAEAAKVWHDLGAKRVVCAREMTLSDIERMRKDAPQDLEIEAFAHGAQCMAVSSRCLISSYLTNRSGNRGHCTQPCRWSYTLEEEKRPGVHFPIEEEGGASFIMNAKDLCMIDHLDDLAQAGVDSIKIEGRNKKAFYVANVVNAYRLALDVLHDEGPDAYKAIGEQMQDEINSVSHRPFGTGFFYGEPEQADDFDGYEQESIHVADVVGCTCQGDGFTLYLRCRNRFVEGEELELVNPRKAPQAFTVHNMRLIADTLEDMIEEYGDPSDDECMLVNEYGAHIGEAPRADIANRSCNIYSVDASIPAKVGAFVRSRTYRRSARHT